MKASGMGICVYIIADTSGSMNEMGKIHLVRNLCRYANQLKVIDQEKYSDIDIRFFEWTEKVSEIIIQEDGNIPDLISKGPANMISLSDFLSSAFANNQMLRVIILSDGNFETKAISSFKNRLVESPDMIIRTVAVGADANLLRLKKLSSDKRVYLPEDISAAIDSAIFGTDQVVTAPESAYEILTAKPAEPEDDWDD